MIDSTVNAIPGAGSPPSDEVSDTTAGGGMMVWSLNKSDVSTVSVIDVHILEASQAVTVTMN